MQPFLSVSLAITMQSFCQMVLSLVLFSVLIWQLYMIIMKEYIHPHDRSSSKHHEDLEKLGFPAIIRICTDYKFKNLGYKNNDHYFMCRFLAHHSTSENSSCRVSDLLIYNMLKCLFAASQHCCILLSKIQSSL